MADFNSNVTYVEWGPIERAYLEAHKNDWILPAYKQIRELDRALSYKTLEERYKIWWNYFYSQSYDEVEVEVKLPKLNENWEYYIQKKLQSMIKNLIK